MARPSKYKAEYAKQAAKLCELGATDQDLAEFFEVTDRTISNWKVAHKPFFQALSASKGGYDDAVERALAMRAVGYSHSDIDIRVVDGQIVETPIVKHYPPDTKACLAWLYNRRGDKWHPQPKEGPGVDDEVTIKIVRAGKDG